MAPLRCIHSEPIRSSVLGDSGLIVRWSIAQRGPRKGKGKRGEEAFVASVLDNVEVLQEEIQILLLMIKDFLLANSICIIEVPMLLSAVSAQQT